MLQAKIVDRTGMQSRGRQKREKTSVREDVDGISEEMVGIRLGSEVARSCMLK